jgi:anthranilate synthase component 1
MGFDPKIILKGYSDKVEITLDGKTETIQTKDPFKELKKLLGKSEDQSYRYLGGAVGVVNYDAIRLVENIPDTHESPQPLMEFGIYDDGILYDNVHKKLFYFYHNQNRFEQFKMSVDSFGDFKATETIPNMNQEKFSNIVNKAKQYIHDGDIFQVVLSRKFTFDTNGDNLTLYKTLRKLNPSPYMYHLKQDIKTIIGASPEMLVRITNDKVETFPIAGTRKITDDEKKNKQLADELLHDEKELAEHTMLVDLGRNDIGRVCKYGTVHTEELMQIKRFSHVQHIVTHVVGNLAPENDMFDAFKAVFPAGTVSGAPKVRAMEIIDELESEARGPYAGAVGYFSFNGCCDFAIAIRSIFINGNKGFVQSGAGIVSDSIAENEFKETEHKAGAMLQALREATK